MSVSSPAHGSPEQLRFATLASRKLIRIFVDNCGVKRGWWSSGHTWRRTYGRYDPGEVCYCTLLFETQDGFQHLCVVEVFEEKPSCHSGSQAVIPHSLLGWLRLNRFPVDPKLQTLPDLIQGSEVIEVLRYRPGRRCTVAVAEEGDDRVLFAKVFADDRGRVIHENGKCLWRAANRGELKFDVAEPIEWDTATRSVWQGQVEGQSIVTDLLEPRGADLAGRMGKACASLSISSLRPWAVFGKAQQLQRTLRYANELKKRAPALRREVCEIVRALQDSYQDLPERPLVPIHGAPHAHQWLSSGERLGLVDFDRFSMGDAELDVATFIAEMDFEDREFVPVEEICAEFVRGYESVYGTLDRALIQNYRSQKRLAKALKAARAVKLDSAAKASRNLRMAAECLREPFS